MGVVSMGILNYPVLNVDNLVTKLVNEQAHLKGDIKYGY
jgi:hypothetical protein